MNRNLARGFTLIELMVTVAIIGILGAIAYPSYTGYLVRSARSAAESHLMALAQAETQFMADSRAYASLADLGIDTPQNVAEKYDITVELTESPPAFKLKATPKADTRQAADGELTIDSAGVRKPDDKW